MNVRILELAINNNEQLPNHDWEETKAYVTRVIGLVLRNAKELDEEIERRPLITRKSFKRAACDILGLTLDEEQDGQAFVSFDEFFASVTALSSRWKEIENAVHRPDGDERPTGVIKQRKRSRIAAANEDPTAIHETYESAVQGSSIRADDDSNSPPNMRRVIEMRKALDQAIRKCQDHIEQLLRSKQKHGFDPVMIGSPLQLLKVLCANYEANSENFVEGVRDSFAAIDIKDLNACQRLKINSPFLISFRIWACVNTEMQGASKDQRLQRYGILWQRATTAKTHSDATRDKYCRIGEWLHQNPWGIFVDLKYATFEAHITTWTQLLAEDQLFKEESQRLMEMMGRLTLQ